jgi:hypothetical protein
LFLVPVSVIPSQVHFRANVLMFPLRQQVKVHQTTSFCTSYFRLHSAYIPWL